jgi:hypothetical protein
MGEAFIAGRYQPKAVSSVQAVFHVKHFVY